MCRRLIPQHDAKTLLEVLDFLNQRVYCRLDASYEPTIRKLEVGMLCVEACTLLATSTKALIGSLSPPLPAGWAAWHGVAPACNRGCASMHSFGKQPHACFGLSAIHRCC